MSEGKFNRVRLARRLLLGVLLVALAATAGYYVVVRWVNGNFHAVVPGEVYRSAQPSPEQLEEWTREHRLRTVVNLRGSTPKDYHRAEAAAAERLGLRLINVRLTATDLPSTIELGKLIDALETAPRPMLIHCRDGADRTGLASVLAALAVGGDSYAEAREQLSLKYFHLDGDPEHIAGVLAQFEAWAGHEGKPRTWEAFRRWAREVYHPLYYRAAISAPAEMTARPGERKQFEATVANASDRAIPAGDPERRFRLAVFLGEAVDETPAAELARRVPLPAKDLPPGESVTVAVTLRAPPEPGKYQVGLDLIEEGVTWFARQGSPVGRIELTVE